MAGTRFRRRFNCNGYEYNIISFPSRAVQSNCVIAHFRRQGTLIPSLVDDGYLNIGGVLPSMIRFPDRRYRSAGEYLNEYAARVASAIDSVSRDALDSAAMLLTACLQRDATIFACGNGGSAAIANHLSCDHQKGIHKGTHYRPRVVSLSSNAALITAVGNDIGYAESFSFPLSLHGRSGDLLITISSSGNSENIVRALQVAESIGMARITFTGFDGGRSRQMADANIHVAAHNYGVVEDVHQACMHILAQYVRQAAMSEELIQDSVF